MFLPSVTIIKYLSFGFPDISPREGGLDNGVMGAHSCAHDPIVQSTLTEGVNAESVGVEGQIPLP